MGMPPGGTRATAGTLKANGFWCPRHTRTFESSVAYDALLGRYSEKTVWELPDKDEDAISIASKVFDEYRERTADAGESRCVLKATWMPLWCPDIFIETNVEPFLVWRDPDKNARSFRQRWANQCKDKSDEEVLAHCRKGQERIEWLHKEYGWKMWRFSKEAGHTAIRKAFGEPFAVEFFNAERIENV